jgi:FkbM family methyltransferase
MKYFLNRIQVYSMYFIEYLKHGEWAAIPNAFLYMFTKQSFSAGKQMSSSMGTFATRKNTLDFQYINYAYEIEIKHFIEKQSFDVFLDVGACLGEYSIWLGRKGYDCFAFEPVKESYEMILKNIELNNLNHKVKAFNYGLGVGSSSEYFQIDQTNPGASKRVDEFGSGTLKFEIKKLDEVYKSFHLNPKTKILVKIDVEGMELLMISGAQEFFNHFENITIIIEEKLIGESIIRDKLSEISNFSFGKIDEFNIYAQKVN